MSESTAFRLPHSMKWVPLAAVAAAVVFTVVLHTLVSDTGLTDGQAIGLSLAQGISLLIALRLPAAAWALSTAAGAVAASWVHSGLWVDAMFNSSLIVLGVISLRVRVRVAVASWCAVVLTGLVLAAAIRPPDWGSALLDTAVVAALATVAGAALRGLLVTRHRLERQRAAAQAARDRSALLQERTQIARELHDVVAHHMSVIAIESETAQYRDPALAPETAASLATIRTGAVTALEEMRRILGVLRSGETGNLPQPALTDLPDLVKSIRATGVPVTLRLAGDTAALSPGRGLSAYRIVQEALSNAVRHAPGAPIEVRVEVGEEVGMWIENAPAAGGAPVPGSGHGLLGMRERVTMLGGTLETGPTPAGGYRVAATLPAEEAPR